MADVKRRASFDENVDENETYTEIEAFRSL